MRLVRLHIENFGKLQNFDHSFSEGKNVCLHENGWGKSTLAAFIRVMFFGFQGESKRTIVDNERKRYRPWQAGAYGGNIVFSANGKEYRIERIFGDKKSATDEFRLYDNRTNMISDDFTSNIGEELFGIDSDSFMRTVFIAQQDCGTEATSGISAKIGNISDQTADMGNYDNIQLSLKKELDRLTPDRATGILSKMNLKIAELKETVQSKDQYVSTLDAVSKALDVETKKREEKERELNKIQKELEKASAVKDLQNDAAKYRELCEQDEEANKNYQTARNEFPGEIPEKETVKEMLSLCDTLKNCRDKVSELSSSCKDPDHKKVFESGFPDNKTLDDIEKKINRLNDLHLERAGREKQRAEESARIFRYMVIEGIAGAVFFFSMMSIFNQGTDQKTKLIFILIGAVSAAISVFLQKKVIDIRKKISSDDTEEEFAALSKEINDFFSKYSMGSDDFHPLNWLFSLKSQISEYIKFRETQNEKDKAEKTASETERKLKDYLLSTGCVENGSLKDQLYALDYKLIKLEHLSGEMKKCRERKEDFEKKKDIIKLKDVDINKMISLEDLNSSFNSLKKEIDDSVKLERQYEAQKNDIVETLDDIRNDETELENLLEESERLTKKYWVIGQTKKFLEKAKLNFSQKYMDDIKTSFEKYHDMISDSKEKYELDANLNIHLKEKGSLHDIELMSEGYKDLVGLCRRVAMVDAMYDKEKPFLVLDDPFVNLDESKMNGAKNFMDFLSEKYQLIYFSCHESRA